MANTHRGLTITAAILLGGGALLSLGILSVNMWSMHDLAARDVLLSAYELHTPLGAFLGMFVASTVLAVFAIRFWRLTPLSRHFVVGCAVASALAVCLALNWFFALYLAVAAGLLALAQGLGGRGHA